MSIKESQEETIALKAKENRIIINENYEAPRTDCVANLRKFISSHKFHMIIIILVVIDALAVGSELLLHEIENHLIPQQLPKCINHLSQQNHVNKNVTTDLSSHDSVDTDIFQNKTHLSLNDYKHEHHENHKLHLLFEIISSILEHITITILGIFTIEVFLKLILVPKIVFNSLWEIIDSIIVVSSFCLNLYLYFNKNEFHNATALLALLRLWRVAEIVNGAVVAIEMKQKMKIERLEKKIMRLEDEIEQLKRSKED